MIVSYMEGFGIGAGLIIAIGAQNAFVLSQSVRRNHPLLIAMICALCDAVLITLGVTGVGAAVAASPVLGRVAAWGGAVFLFWCGFGAFRSMLRGGSLQADVAAETSIRAVVLATLAVTLLNPHVYLDTVVTLGGISGRLPEAERYVFGAGAATASVVWFLTLSLGGRALAPVFTRPTAWRVLDGAVCATMWVIGLALLREAVAA